MDVQVKLVEGERNHYGIKSVKRGRKGFEVRFPSGTTEFYPWATVVYVRVKQG